MQIFYKYLQNKLIEYKNQKGEHILNLGEWVSRGFI